MIRLDNVQLALGGQVIFDSVNWQAKDNDRISLVGPNGAGKTTLLKLVTGEISPDRGEVIVPKNDTIGHLPQELVFLKGNTVFEEVRKVFGPVLEVQDKMRDFEQSLSEESPESSHYQQLLDEYGHLSEHFESQEGYQIDAKIGEVLSGLGFSQTDLTRPVEEFSGGWQMRIVLSKLLLSKPTILLLDEPTNHLDLEARNWLEEYLKNYPGTIILVSHDRFFLDIVTHRITEIEHGNVTDYYSNYEGYLTEKEARYERLESQLKRQQDNVQRMQTFINKYRYDKRRSSLVQSRIKMLGKMDTISLPPRQKEIRFKFPDSPRSGRVIMELHDIHKSYDALTVFSGISLLIERGDRICLVGPNGAGKSTLMRILAGTQKFNQGNLSIGHNVHRRFMDQDVASSLNIENLVIHELQDTAPYDIVPQIRTLLGAFLFSGDDVNKKISVLSGGEKSRLAIAKMLLEPANLLLLDEPTNHLDIQSQQILLNSLRKFTGTIIFVSHERYFINELAEKIYEVDNGRLTIYQGNYEDYRVKKVREESKSPPKKQKTGKTKQKDDNDLKREKRKLIARNKRKRRETLEHLELTIQNKEKKLSDLESILSDPDLYKEGQRTKELVTQHKQIRQELQNLYDEWADLGDENPS